MKRVLFVVSTAGLGHVTRCRALMGELAQRGWRGGLTNKPPMSATSHDVTVLDVGEPHADLVQALSARPVVAVVDEPCGTSIDLCDLVVCPSAGITSPSDWGFIGYTLAGPQYALLRPEFRDEREQPAERGITMFDCREVSNMTASDMARTMRRAGEVFTYGGMRAMEAACVRKGSAGLRIEVRNPGEALNACGLTGDRLRDMVDGLGCVRVADEIDGRFS